MRWWLLALAACHTDPPPAPPPSCGQVAEHVRALMPPDDANARPIHDVFVKRCTADHWGADVLRCIGEEPSLTARRHCREQLTPLQRDALDADLAPIAQRVATPAGYRTVMTEVVVALGDMMGDPSCDKIAGELRAYYGRNKARIKSARAWEKTHAADAQNIKHQLLGDLSASFEPLMNAVERCVTSEAFNAAMQDFDSEE